jgi:hypothetical protein
MGRYAETLKEWQGFCGAERCPSAARGVGSNQVEQQIEDQGFKRDQFGAAPQFAPVGVAHVTFET